MSENEKRGSILRPFRNRNFVLVWTGQAVSSIGNTMYRVTLAWTVYNVTNSSAAMGLVLAVNVVPQLLLTLLGGVLADRLPRRSLMLVCDLAAGLVTALLAAVAAAHGSSLGFFLAVALVLGIVSSFFGPAYSPIYRNLLSIEDQQAAAAIQTTTKNLTQVLGPALGGLVLSLGGAVLGFGLDAGTFFFAAVCTTLVTVPKGTVKYHGTVFGDLKRGLVLVSRVGWLRTVILISLLANVACVAPIVVLLPAVVKDVGGGGELLGVANAVLAASSSLFALVAGKYAHRVPRGVAVYLLAAVVGLGVVMLGEGVSMHWLILPAMAVVGLGFAFNVLESAMIQEQTPERYLSRVYSVAMVASYVLGPLGYSAAGALANSVGDRNVLLWGGVLLAAVSIGGGFATRWRLSGTVELDEPELAHSAA